jgi:hypothetical protein
MIKNAEKIDHDIKTKPLTEQESLRLSQEIAAYKKRRKAKRKKIAFHKKTTC